MTVLGTSILPMSFNMNGTYMIRMRIHGHSFSYEWLSSIGGSTKTGKSNYAGKYGEGFQLPMKTSVMRKKPCLNFFILEIYYLAKKLQLRITMLCMGGLR